MKKSLQNSVLERLFIESNFDDDVLYSRLKAYQSCSEHSFEISTRQLLRVAVYEPLVSLSLRQGLLPSY